MNAVFASSLLLATFVAAASNIIQELCVMDDEPLEMKLHCISSYLPESPRVALDEAIHSLTCMDSYCAVRKMCEGGDLVAAMSLFFTPQHIWQFEVASSICD
ncbi:hypothetical protein V5799_007588 [Amblyomma americanum]|uniref:Uncharacterized protein n=1 Tax=Amblyomma americanum TaxID=6943 RepID=A0AAQ4FFM6_AMBAM